jgi:hypothetical protein
MGLATVSCADLTLRVCRPSATYLADVVELICKKRQMDDLPKDWVLCLADLSFVLPIDRTVESLMGVTDLALVKRSWAATHGLKGGGQRGGDPNGVSHCQPSLARQSLCLTERSSLLPVSASVFKDFHEQRRQPATVSGFDSPYQVSLVIPRRSISQD